MARTAVVPEATRVSALSPNCDVQTATRDVRFTSTSDIARRGHLLVSNPPQLLNLLEQVNESWSRDMHMVR